MKFIYPLLFGILISCSETPKPCDPEFVSGQQMAIAAVCRSKAESSCVGYSDMTEEQKLKCPGVLECLNNIEKIERDCHGN